MENKVYCSECKHEGVLFLGFPSGEVKCLHPNSCTQTITWHSKFCTYGKCAFRNASNDCPDFEEREPIKIIEVPDPKPWYWRIFGGGK